MVIALNLPANAQFVDDFSDNDFVSNPTWEGDISKFAIENFELRLKAPAEASAAYLSTPSGAINNAEWTFTIRMEFNPSSSNYGKIYLVADQQDLLGPLNGYYILVGDTPDEISLYRQSGNGRIKIIDGADGMVNLSTVNVAIKVTRDDAGSWQLFADVNLTGSYSLVGTAVDDTFDSSSFFGIVCNYTSTRSDKFYFDNFLVTGDPYQDTDPPTISHLEVVSDKTLLVHFDEALDHNTANDPANYSVGNNIGIAISAVIQSNEFTIELTFNKEFENGVAQLLEVSNIKDVAGNIMISDIKTFLYFNPIPAIPKDVIINEFLADPSPQVGLPDAEYIELYNRSTNPFELSGWTFSDGNSTATLPSKIMLPGEYLVITSTSNSSKFGMTNPAVGVSNFPTLNNSADVLVLKSPIGITIDSINYDLSWYRSVDKQEGGWSLELIDPANICAEEENWSSADNDSGGTPGTVNSVFANKPDLAGPHLLSVTVLSPGQLRLTFDEKLENPISSSASYLLSPEALVSNYYFESNALRSIILELNSPLITKQLYQITVSGLYDCSGNLISEEFNAIAFALPENAEVGDVIINEILFNPRPGGVDFVELYNNSDKFIDLKNWGFGNFEDEQIENQKLISAASLIIAPKSYLAFTNDMFVLKDHYPLGEESSFVQTSLPSFPDDLGSVALVTESNLIVDYFVYSKQFHSQLIKDEEGVSLERISFNEPTNENSNWTSASAISGFATPGKVNSNFRPNNGVAIGEVKIEPRIFSPLSGNSNFSQISFQFDQTGFVANVKILDQQGRLIKTVANNYTIGFNGSFKWDGDNDDGSKARAGYYIVWFEVFDSLGRLITFRERVIIAQR